MQESIRDNIPPVALRDPDHTWWRDTRATDDFLDPVFRAYLGKLGLPVSLMKKSDYHILARFVLPKMISPEVVGALDAILAQSNKTKPRGEDL